MCTLSWVRHDEGYTVLFNRDERRTRSPGLLPSVQMRGGVRFLAPADPDAGGTWAAVNDHRIALCILNQYDVPRPPTADPVSRGLLLLSLADLTSQAEVWNRVKSSGLMQYAPFTLAAFEPGLPALLLNWDGRGLTDQSHGSTGLVITSSSVAQREADQSRRRLFEKALAVGAIGEDVLDRLHRSHLPAEGALSVCMHREDAETVSLTKLAAGRSGVALSYVAGAPCRARTPVTLSLAVRAPSPSY